MEEYLLCEINGEKGKLKVGFEIDTVVLSVTVEKLRPAPFDGIFNGFLVMNKHEYPFFSLSSLVLDGKPETRYAVIIDTTKYNMKNEIAVGIDKVYGIKRGNISKGNLKLLPFFSKMVDDFYVVNLVFILKNSRWKKLLDEIERAETDDKCNDNDKNGGIEVIAFPSNPPLAIKKENLIGLLYLEENLCYLPSVVYAVGVVQFMNRIIPVYDPLKLLNDSDDSTEKIIAIFSNWKAFILPPPTYKKMVKLTDYVAEDSLFDEVAISRYEKYFMLKPSSIDKIIKLLKEGRKLWKT